MFAVVVGKFLNDQIVLLGICHLLDRFGCFIEHLQQLFVAAAVDVLLQLTLLALELPVHVGKFFLATDTLAFAQRGCIFIKALAEALNAVAQGHQIFVTLGELLLQTALGRFCGGRFGRNALVIDIANTGFLRVCTCAKDQQQQTQKTFFYK